MMRPSPSRKKAERRGQLGEVFAALYLRLKLYHIVKRRFKTPVGEIDLIAQRFGKLVFVEVKTRRNLSDMDVALQSVNQKRITRAAQYFVVKTPHLANRSMRFDVIFLAPGRWPRHVRNAF